MDFAQNLAQLTPDKAVQTWVSEQFDILKNSLSECEAELHLAKLKTQALILELAQLRRVRYGQSTERIAAATYDLFDPLDESTGADISEIEAQIQSSTSASDSDADLKPDACSVTPGKQKRSGAGRQRLPEHLPRIEHRHELPSCDCARCGSALSLIGEDVSEQLDVTPASFFVHRHIRPQYACKGCESVTAAPVPAAVIDGSLAAPGLISWVLTSKFVDHLPLYRLEQIAVRSNVSLARSTLAQWVGQYGFALQPLVERMRALLKLRSVLHADETPIKQLAPGKGSTQRAYLWAYCSSEFSSNCGEPVNDQPPIVIFDYQMSRSGVHARSFLSDWQGHLMCDDYVGYKAMFTEQPNITELGCMAHARRKFFDLHAANGSPIAFEVMRQIAQLYEVEREMKVSTVQERAARRAEYAIPRLTQIKEYLIQTKMSTAKGGALAKAIDYSLKRWDALSRYAHSGHLPIDNNPIENAIRPIAIGKKNWLFTGSERSGKRAAAIQSLFATAKRNELDPQAWVKDVIEKLPTWPNSRIDELLPFKGYRFG